MPAAMRDTCQQKKENVDVKINEWIFWRFSVLTLRDAGPIIHLSILLFAHYK